MSNGVINSPSGAHEHHTGVESGLISKDKSTYAQKSVELYYERELLRKKRKQVTDNYNEAIQTGRKQSVVSNENNTQANAQGRVSSTNRTDVSTANELYTAKNYTPEQVKKQNDVSSSAGATVSNSERFGVAHTGQQYNSDNYNETIQTNKNQSSAVSRENTSQESTGTDVSTRYSSYVKYTDGTKSDEKNKSGRFNSSIADKAKSVTMSTAKVVSTGASYLAESQSYQNDEGTGEAAAHKMENITNSTVKKVDKLTNSRYFKFSGKASDSVKVAKSSSRFVTATSAMKKLGKKGVAAVDNVLVNPIVKVAGDDIGSQTAVKMIETSRDVYKVGKTSVKYGYKATKATYTAGKNTVKYGKKATEATTKATQAAAKATAKATQAATKAVVTTTKAVVTAATQLIAFIAANPIVLIIVLVVLVVVLLVLMCGAFMGGTTEYASYEGAGNTTTMSVNNYSDIYDYTNKAIAQRCLDLFNMRNTWTGYLEYHYEYRIEQDDGTFIESTSYPVADVAPIMAYLSVNYESYTLTDNIKTEINNIVHHLYTFDYLIEDCTHTVDHGSGNIEYIYGEKVTYTVIYHNAAKFFEENGYIASKKMTAYNAVKSYGDISYFRMYNLFGDKNWHEWISEQYGYSVEAKYNQDTEQYEYELIELDYCTLEYRNDNNETASKIYSPLNGKVTSVTETDDYEKVVTIKDSENNLEFTMMVDFEDTINLMVRQGETVTAGQQIATRNYQIYIKCKSDGNEVSPMLLMEYFQHAN